MKDLCMIANSLCKFLVKECKLIFYGDCLKNYISLSKNWLQLLVLLPQIGLTCLM